MSTAADPAAPVTTAGAGAEPARAGHDRVYLDHASTTPVRPEARAALVDWIDAPRGNPSGSHGPARAARRALDDARDVLAAVLRCGPGDIVFTAGGTEADNLAVLGVAEAVGPGAVVACSAAEHHAVLEAVHHLEHRRPGSGVVLPVDAAGAVHLDRLVHELPADAALVSVMAANNEVGTITPVDRVVELVRERTGGRAVVHTDAVAAFPWVDVGALAASAGLVSLSAHKFGGPQGVGLLVVRPGVPLRARLLGGGQERDRRSGTQNVAGILAMAAAAAATHASRAATVARVGVLRDRFVDSLRSTVDGVHETVDRSRKVAGNAHLCIEGVVSEELLFLVDGQGVCASAGSSCASGAVQLSHVLAAMGVAPELGAGALRFTLGWTTTEAEVDRAVDVVAAGIGRLRQAHRTTVPA